MRSSKPKEIRWLGRQKVGNALRRVGQITKKYGVRAFSYAVKKKDYDDLMPEKWKEVAGRYHYTWAIKHVLRLLRDWDAATNPNNPVEYFFDWQEGEAKYEIERMMSQEESVRPGKYEGHYSFRKRKEVPALQCTDLLAWSSFSRARYFFEDTPMNEYAEKVYTDFRDHHNQKWLSGATQIRGNLAETIRRHLIETLEEKEKEEWYAAHAAECIARPS